MATKKFLLLFRNGESVDRTIVDADTEQEAKEVFAASNPDDRILKILGPQEA